MTVRAGIDQTTSSMRPEYSQSGQYDAFVLAARNQKAEAKIATIVGRTIASMIAIESIRMVLSAAPIGPCGSRIFIAEPENEAADYGTAAPRFRRRNHMTRIDERLAQPCEVSSPYLNFGTTGMVIRGAGSGATLDALPIPLGSTITLFIPPAFAGPGPIPLIGTLPDPAPPAVRDACANEAAGVARASINAKTIFAAVLDMTKLHCSTRAFA